MTMTRRQRRVVVAPVLVAVLIVLTVVGAATPPCWPHACAVLSALADTLSYRVYPVSMVASGLAQAPRRWSGRTLWVQGVVAADRQWRDTLDGWVLLGPPRLTDPAGRVDWPLVWGSPDPTLARLRTVPLLGRAVPPPQTVSWGRLAIYRVQLHIAASRVCPDCFEAVLVDTAG